ncbi:MAG: DUF2752 domain-containing protein [bacterium]|nr:DUF2752 domain-containing protein [bacterium]
MKDITPNNWFKHKPTNNYQLLLLIFIIPTLIFIISFCWNPNPNPKWTICYFQMVTGLPCPGCGLTRGICAISHGHLMQAIYFNPISPFAYLTLLYFWIKGLIELITKQEIYFNISSKIKNKLGFTALIGIIIFWAVRIIFHI